MLPNSSSSLSTSSSIYINPKFRNVHINPNFLSKSNVINQQTVEPVITTVPTQIYINPRFLGQVTDVAITQSTISPPQIVHAKENFAHLASGYEFNKTIASNVEPLADTKIHSRTKIYNKSIVKQQILPNSTNVPKIVYTKIDNAKPLIRFGSKKLIRVSPIKSSKIIPKVRRPLQTKYKIIKEQTAFKIDRRSAKAKLAAVTRNIIPFVLSRKFWINELLMPSKTITR